MTESSHPTKVIILDRERGWCILQLPEGAVQLDMGVTGVVFAPGEFRALADMLAQARAAPEGEAILAVGGRRRQVLFYETQQIVVVIFGRAIIRVDRPDFAAFVRLCDRARTLLAPLPVGAFQPPLTTRFSLC